MPEVPTSSTKFAQGGNKLTNNAIILWICTNLVFFYFFYFFYSLPLMTISFNTLMIWPASSLVFRDNKTFQFALVSMTCFIIKNLYMIKQLPWLSSFYWSLSPLIYSLLSILHEIPYFQLLVTINLKHRPAQSELENHITGIPRILCKVFQGLKTLKVRQRLNNVQYFLHNTSSTAVYENLEREELKSWFLKT